MVETVAGIWLFLLTFGAGFLAGRFSRVQHRGSSKAPTAVTGDNFGWQELLNFLQYDGSGRLPANTKELGGKSDEEQHHGGTNSARVRARHPL
ncbi:MAG: hypothetical protein J6L00_05055 [Clostridia bacterium]|nr:hypothetical protein [Clostridia bacterium]